MKTMAFLFALTLALAHLTSEVLVEPSGLPDLMTFTGDMPIMIGVVSINFYNKFIEYMGDGTIDLDDETIGRKCNLMTDSHSFSATDTIWANVSANEIPAGNGYTQNTKVLGTPTWTESSGVLTFDGVNVTWAASGGPIPTSGLCQHMVLMDDDTSAVVDALYCSVGFGASESAGDGTNFVITWHVNGIFTVT